MTRDPGLGLYCFTLWDFFLFSVGVEAWIAMGPQMG
jgi:hypothetical protein